MDEMSLFRLDVSRETGMATLLVAAIGSPCSFKPILSWPSTEGVKKFAEVLLEMYRAAEEKRGPQCGLFDAS